MNDSLPTMHAPLLIDVAGTTLKPYERERLRHPLVGGVTLFARNWADRNQLTRLCQAIKRARPDALIAVDHEGGRVQRFRTDGFTELPAMRRLGAHWRQAQGAGQAGQAALQAMDLATACGFVLAAELRACGVDMSFTPVLDLDHGRSDVIGDRAFDADPRVVTALARALTLGLTQAGMVACGKHFPGHGYARADSHVAKPVDGRPLATLLGQDALPYGYLRSALQAVMPAHVVYPAVDALPAGFSSVWLQRILRQQLGFNGAIFSDDLSMTGAREINGEAVDTTTAALAALHAGCDLVLLCNQSVVQRGAPIDDLIEGLAAAWAQGRWVPSQASELRRQALLPRLPWPDWAALMTDARYQQALAQLETLA